MVDGAKVARTLVDIENPMQPFISQIWNSTHCCYCSYKLTGNEIRVTGFPFSKKSRDTILHPGKLHPLKKKTYIKHTYFPGSLCCKLVISQEKMDSYILVFPVLL